MFKTDSTWKYGKSIVLIGLTFALSACRHHFPLFHFNGLEYERELLERAFDPSQEIQPLNFTDQEMTEWYDIRDRFRADRFTAGLVFNDPLIIQQIEDIPFEKILPQLSAWNFWTFDARNRFQTVMELYFRESGHNQLTYYPLARLLTEFNHLTLTLNTQLKSGDLKRIFFQIADAVADRYDTALTQITRRATGFTPEDLEIIQRYSATRKAFLEMAKRHMGPRATGRIQIMKYIKVTY